YFGEYPNGYLSSVVIIMMANGGVIFLSSLNASSGCSDPCGVVEVGGENGLGFDKPEPRRLRLDMRLDAFEAQFQYVLFHRGRGFEACDRTRRGRCCLQILCLVENCPHGSVD